MGRPGDTIRRGVGTAGMLTLGAALCAPSVAFAQLASSLPPPPYLTAAGGQAPAPAAYLYDRYGSSSHAGPQAAPATVHAPPAPSGRLAWTGPAPLSPTAAAAPEPAPMAKAEMTAPAPGPARTEGGVRLYSVHRDYGLQPDPTPLPPAAFTSGADLAGADAEAAAPQPSPNTAAGRLAITAQRLAGSSSGDPGDGSP